MCKYSDKFSKNIYHWRTVIYPKIKYKISNLCSLNDENENQSTSSYPNIKSQEKINDTEIQELPSRSTISLVKQVELDMKRSLNDQILISENLQTDSTEMCHEIDSEWDDISSYDENLKNPKSS